MRKAAAISASLGGLGLLALGVLLISKNPAWLHSGWMWGFVDGSHANLAAGIVALACGAISLAGAVLVTSRAVTAALLFGALDVICLLVVYVSPNLDRFMAWYAAPGVLLSLAAFLAAMEVGRVVKAEPLNADLA
ncbi:MAG: hypothetical protein ABR925_07990 [Acidimicrobiales bacterium]|jgi:hypothetical protein